jgi:hypothetical protein
MGGAKTAFQIPMPPSPDLLLVVEAEDGIRIRRMAVERFRVLAEHPLLSLTRSDPLRLRMLADGSGWVCGQFSERQIFAAIEPDGRAGRLLPAVPGRGVLDPANGHIHGNGSLTVLELVREAPEGTRVHSWKPGGDWTTEHLPLDITDVSYTAYGQTWFVGCRQPPVGSAPSAGSQPAVWVRDSDGQPANPLPFKLDTPSRVRGALADWLLAWSQVESFHGVCAECDPPLLIAYTPDPFETSFSWLYRPTGQRLWHAYPIRWGGIQPVVIPDGLVVFTRRRMFLSSGSKQLRQRNPMPGLRRALALEKPDLITVQLQIVAGDTLDGRSLAVVLEWQGDQTGSALAVSRDGGDTWKVITLAIGQSLIRDVAWTR